jgi:PAS domain S-box-containing protein
MAQSLDNYGGQNPNRPDVPESAIIYKNLAEQSFVGIYIVQDGLFRYANSRMAEIFGYTLDEFVGRIGPEQVVHWADWPHIRERSKKRLIGEVERDYYQFSGIKKDKSVITVEVYGSVIPYKGKRAVSGVVNDITERIVMNRDLRESEAMFRNLAEQSFVGVYIVQDGLFRYANPRMAEIFGYRPDEFVGRIGPQQVIHPEDWPHIRERSQKRFDGEVERDYYQLRGIKKDKSVITVEVYGSRQEYKGKKAIIGIVNDITARITAGESLPYGSGP